jgi:hypothetical protein
MSKLSRTSLMVLCAALTACSDSHTTRMVTAPDVRPTFSEAPADISVGFTPDGPFELALPSEDASTQMAASAQAAAGSRAAGHVGFPTGWAGTVITFEKYSFVAVSIDPATPFAAKGQYEIELATTAGNTLKVQGDVTCMFTFGNTTRVGGQITRYWRDGVAAPIPPTGTHNIWVVVDNGESAATPDQVSLMRFGPAVAAQTYCATGFLSFVSANQEGNVQVQP